MSKKQRDHAYFFHHTEQPESLRLAEHEWALAFTNDSGCYAFDEWWGMWGKDLYAAWVTEELSRLNEDYS